MPGQNPVLTLPKTLANWKKLAVDSSLVASMQLKDCIELPSRLKSTVFINTSVAANACTFSVLAG